MIPERFFPTRKYLNPCTVWYFSGVTCRSEAHLWPTEG